MNESIAFIITDWLSDIDHALSPPCRRLGWSGAFLRTAFATFVIGAADDSARLLARVFG
jgi:hypothetical protein